MVYFTLVLEIEENLSASEILKQLRDAATRWGKCINKTPKTRKKVKNNRNNYYMEVGYES
jgi:hypothetical protein